MTTRFLRAVLFAALVALPSAAAAQTGALVVEGTITFGAPPAAAPAAPTAPILAPAPPPVVAAPAARPQSVVASAPAVEAAPPRTTRRWGLVGAGAGIALGGYALNLVGTLLWMAIPTGVASVDFLVPTWNGHREELLLWSLVPVAGPLAQIAYAEEDWQIPLFIVSSALQIAGFTMAIVGTASRVTVEARTTPTVTVTPYASTDGGGVVLGGTF